MGLWWINAISQSYFQSYFTGNGKLLQFSSSEVILKHYCDAIMGAMASQITSLSIVYIKENFKVPRHWPLCGEFTGDRWIPRTKDQ